MDVRVVVRHFLKMTDAVEKGLPHFEVSS